MATVIMFIKFFIDHRSRVVARLKELVAAKQVDTDEYRLLSYTLSCINLIRDYIVNGDWARASTRQKLITWIQLGYNYNLTATKFGTDAKCIRVLVSRADAILSKLLRKPLDMILQGDVDDGLLEFRINTNRLDVIELFGTPVNLILPSASDIQDCYALSDCKAEIKFMRTYNSYEIRHQLNALDSDKLMYLLALASSKDNDYKDERRKLIRATIKFDNKTN